MTGCALLPLGPCSCMARGLLPCTPFLHSARHLVTDDDDTHRHQHAHRTLSKHQSWDLALHTNLSPQSLRQRMNKLRSTERSVTCPWSHSFHTAEQRFKPERPGYQIHTLNHDLMCLLNILSAHGHPGAGEILGSKTNWVLPSASWRSRGRPRSPSQSGKRPARRDRAWRWDRV